jgi:hypothetical protein
LKIINPAISVEICIVVQDPQAGTATDLLNKEQGAECDATVVYSSNKVWLKKIFHSFFFLANALIKTGSRMRLVNVPASKVSDVNQPSALVPPN